MSRRLSDTWFSQVRRNVAGDAHATTSPASYRCWRRERPSTASWCPRSIHLGREPGGGIADAGDREGEVGLAIDERQAAVSSADGCRKMPVGRARSRRRSRRRRGGGSRDRCRRRWPGTPARAGRSTDRRGAAVASSSVMRKHDTWLLPLVIAEGSRGGTKRRPLAAKVARGPDESAMEKHSVGSLLPQAVPTAQVETLRIRNASTRRVALGGDRRRWSRGSWPVVLPQPRRRVAASSDVARGRRHPRGPRGRSLSPPDRQGAGEPAPGDRDRRAPVDQPVDERSTCPASTPASIRTGPRGRRSGVGDRAGPGSGERAAARAGRVGGGPRQAREAEPPARAQIQRRVPAAQRERRAQRRAPGRRAHRTGVGPASASARVSASSRSMPGRPVVSPRSTHRRAKVQPSRRPPPHRGPCARTARPPARAPARARRRRRAPRAEARDPGRRAAAPSRRRARAVSERPRSAPGLMVSSIQLVITSSAAPSATVRAATARALRGKVHGARELLAGDRVDDGGLHCGAVAGDADLGDAGRRGQGRRGRERGRGRGRRDDACVQLQGGQTEHLVVLERRTALDIEADLRRGRIRRRAGQPGAAQDRDRRGQRHAAVHGAACRPPNRVTVLRRGPCG